MDIAKMSMALSQASIKLEANLATMSHMKNFAEQQGEQMIEMMQQMNPPTVPHPTSGQKIDISI